MSSIDNLNSDKWNSRYKSVTKSKPSPYGDTITYKNGAEFLKLCKTVEDWGCGRGWFRNICLSEKYIGIDGSITPHSDIKADLTNYKSSCDGIYMRHVLEHNIEWKKILNNACQSFTQKMVLVLFTPFKDSETILAWNDMGTGKQNGVPDISFKKEDITSIFDEYKIQYKMETINNSNTQYKIEYIFYLQK